MEQQYNEELEEGELKSHLDDMNIDPNITLSYLDDKIKDLLGNFQQLFEGCVSIDNLGPVFGGYGSFLRANPPPLPPIPTRPGNMDVHSPMEIFHFYSHFSGSNMLSPLPRKLCHLDAKSAVCTEDPQADHGSTGRWKDASVPLIKKRKFTDQMDGSKKKKLMDGRKIQVHHIQSENEPAASIIKEASDLKGAANRLMKECNLLENIDLHFYAAIKFLEGASLLKSGIICKQPYTETIKLCEFCAREYEKRGEMSFAALAYKCIEVAYLRLVYGEHSTAAKDYCQLKTSCNAAAESTLDKIKFSPQANCPHPRLENILTYVDSVNSAMDASRRSLHAFESASKQSKQSGRNAKGLQAVRKALDFSFHDMDGLLHLVRQAMEFFAR